MFNQIFIEQDLINNTYAKNILSKLKQEPEVINRFDDIWGVVKKPYLQKRDNLNLFIAKKRGSLVKEAPDAYGFGTGKHYYFIHAYNCIYECSYCYLQGYFKTPDIVLFVNHDEIISEMEKICDASPNAEIWFHAGEFSDSMALSHLTDEYGIYWDFFKRYPNAKLELRTKSVNIRSIKDREPLKNITISFSLSPEKQTKDFDLKTPSLKSRLRAIKELSDLSFKIGIHLDPVIYHENFEQQYLALINDLEESLNNDHLTYISIGVVRFTKEVFEEFKRNYPDSTILKQEFVKSFDEKIRYHRPIRGHILTSLEAIINKSDFDEKKVYRCME